MTSSPGRSRVRSGLCFLMCVALLHFFVPQTSRASDNDSLSLLSRKRANRTALSSALLPGLGQGINKKYWKIPIIYAGFGTLVYLIDFNNNYYQKFKTAYRFRNDTDPGTVDDYPRYSNDDLRVRKDYYRRNRDLCYILGGVLYSLNIIDAYVDAQLLDFDVSDDLSLRTIPFLETIPTGETMAGFKFTLQIK
ncbi:MAG TPA: DUF5683 domain-containing protein [Bacteroidia bacterium]|nr:DUF5683 domain-containing protein [Bacteroidia bacterium]